MQYENLTTSCFTSKDLKKRLEDIQGELRYVSYTAEMLSRELSLLITKIEELSDEMSTDNVSEEELTFQKE